MHKLFYFIVTLFKCNFLLYSLIIIIMRTAHAIYLPQTKIYGFNNIFSLNKSIIANITTSIIDGYTISVAFGKDAYFHQLKLNMLNNYTLINSFRKEKNDKCSSIAQHEIIYDYKHILNENLYPCKSSVYIENKNDENSLTNFNYFLMTDNSFQGSLGLTYVFQAKIYSLVHMLNSKYIISEKSFGFFNEGSRRKFFIGSLPLQNNLSLKENLCQVNTNNEIWSCYYNEIAFDDNRFVPNHLSSVTFNAGQYSIYASKEIWNFITKTVFKTLLKRNLCVMLKSKGDSYIRCRKGIENQIQKFTLTINNTQYVINKDKLFIYYLSTVELIIRYRKKYAYIFSLGTVFLDLFHIAIFNYDLGVISFYNNNPNLTLHSTILYGNNMQIKNYIIKTIISLNILYIFIYFLFVRKVIYNKHN